MARKNVSTRAYQAPIKSGALTERIGTVKMLKIKHDPEARECAKEFPYNGNDVHAGSGHSRGRANVSPPNARDHASFANVGGKVKSNV